MYNHVSLIVYPLITNVVSMCARVISQKPFRLDVKLPSFFEQRAKQFLEFAILTIVLVTIVIQQQMAFVY